MPRFYSEKKVQTKLTLISWERGAINESVNGPKAMACFRCCRLTTSQRCLIEINGSSNRVGAARSRSETSSECFLLKTLLTEFGAVTYQKDRWSRNFCQVNRSYY